MHLTLLLTLLAPVWMGAAEKPAAAAGDSIRIAVRGTLRHGVVAPGGETTGTTITADGILFELDLGQSRELIDAARKLDGKKALTAGRLTRRAGVETGTRWIIRAQKLVPVGTTPRRSAADEGTPERKDLKKLLARAAGVDARVMEKIATSPMQPTFSDFESQTLTAIVLALPGAKEGASKKKEQFRYEGPVKPKDLFAEIYRSKGFGPLRIKPDFATILQEDRITDIRERRDGDDLRGTVSFRVPRMYAGKVDFVARPSGDSWRIVEFSLPAYGIRTRLDPTGKWKLVEKGPLGGSGTR